MNSLMIARLLTIGKMIRSVIVRIVAVTTAIDVLCTGLRPFKDEEKGKILC